MSAPRMPKMESRDFDLQEKVVFINRVSKVVKGGRRFSFSAVVVVGDGHGHVGAGMGKANEVPDAIKKGSAVARKNLITVPMNKNTIAHPIVAHYGAAKVMMKPASPGTGLIAGIQRGVSFGVLTRMRSTAARSWPRLRIRPPWAITE